MKADPQRKFKTIETSFSIENTGQSITIPICIGVKPLRLAYELSWRTKSDEQFLRSAPWKKLRQAILDRDDNTCAYCGFKSLFGMQVNHIDGNPKNNDYENLETVCSPCHMVMHSGLWCVVKKVMDCYAESKYDQNKIIQISRKLRESGLTDNEIIEFLGLKQKVQWKQDLQYLSTLYGFITSRSANPSSQKPILTEKEQQKSLANRGEW